MEVKKLRKQETQPESFSDSESSLPSGVIIYSDEEVTAMRQVRAKLKEEHGVEESRVGSAFLAVATINCKLKVDETVVKITKLLEIMEQLGCADGIDDELWKPSAKHEFRSYPPVGTDARGCSITWIRGSGRVSKEEERNHVHGCIMQYLAVHSDANTLRNGVSFIIDLTGKDNKTPKTGNEKLIQSFYQTIPQRPQIILIAGASFATRTIVNASIKFASFFIKQKVLQRIHFVTVEEAKNMLPLKSAPVYIGGGGGGIESYEDWVEERLEQLPMPELSENDSSPTKSSSSTMADECTTKSSAKSATTMTVPSAKKTAQIKLSHDEGTESHTVEIKKEGNDVPLNTVGAVEDKGAIDITTIESEDGSGGSLDDMCALGFPSLGIGPLGQSESTKRKQI
mmetsp:Transcript_13499/g.29327  ORF Transcript_13499/g.29327 Transcript_13499/m.29327 type:complete len:398 (+) Transcript_13499:128-1321(+)|eukprot:CAMPEP_0172307456 /NCGR_PEP_ID=MMETSP1058-20130122/8310_1 /TAXON_ID=83371 /ORGANISM="Detonula confervacea, Strain CCMP 353" /LENGTH=397 /DNA_ID=CAMNT_0013019627 /DNA_START=128 /DNA_END=1321 /DNA_ORIENTATION=-